MASKAVVNARSAFPWTVKRTVLTQEVLRMMLHWSRLVPWEVVVRHVDEIVLRMQLSGHTKKFRYEVIDSALKAYRAMEEAERRGERPMYRPNGWNREEREQERVRKKVNWYKKNGSESVIFVPATPELQLQKEYQRDVWSQRFNVRVVEKAGESLKKMLQRSNPLKERQCRRMDCLVCTTGGKGPCDRQGVTYEIVCNECDSVYIGESSRSAYTRGAEHMKVFSKKDERSALWRHCKEKHGGELRDFNMSVTGFFPLMLC